jgi:hypothetical protein
VRSESDPAVQTTGNQPLRLLQYDPTPGETRRWTMVSEMASEIEAGGIEVPTAPIPTTTVFIDLAVSNVTDGQITLDYAFADIRNDWVMPGMTEANESLAKSRGSVTMTRGGQPLATELVLAEDLDPLLAELLQSLKSEMANLVVPFPDAPVGIGAVWTLATTLEAAGVTWSADRTFELTDLTDDEFVVTFESEVTVEPSTITVEGQVVDIVSGSGSGTTSCTGRLASPLTLRCDASSSIETVIEPRGANGSQMIERLHVTTQVHADDRGV